LPRQFALAPRSTHEALYKSAVVPFHESMDLPYTVAGLSLAAHSAKDAALTLRLKTKTESLDACKMSGWTWLANSALRRAR
jgi:hypothetical protein